MAHQMNRAVTMESVKKLIAERDEIDQRIAAEEQVLKNVSVYVFAHTI